MILILILLTAFIQSVPAWAADMILHNGKIVAVDSAFSVAEAVAVRDGRIVAVGSNERILALANDSAPIIDLHGKTVIPGLIDNHLHPQTACVSELQEEIPDVRSIAELLAWIGEQAKKKKPGEWIIHPKLFFTRLQEMRAPTKAELDAAAPQHPVFLNGSYGGVVNSAALRASRLTNVEHPGLQRDAKSGELTGFIRASAFRLLKVPPEQDLPYEQRLDALEKMLRRYNAVGLTSVCDCFDESESLRLYRDLRDRGRLTVRVFRNIRIAFDFKKPLADIKKEIRKLGHRTGDGDEWVRVGALKTFMDGGILTGTAWLRQPWGEGAKEVYGIADPTYRGVLHITAKELAPLVQAACESGWKFTAHCTGGGGVDVMLDAFEKVNGTHPLSDRRFSIIHGNFFTTESMERMQKLGVYADMQPAWFYKDADLIRRVLGEKRLATFHPYKSLFDAGVVVNGGSDHMVKFDSRAAINPYNPFLAMWTVVTRTTERGSSFSPQQALTREQALKMYTINNAYASFEEDVKGSIEPGKLADLVVLSDDLLICAVDRIKDIRALMTIVGGKIVYAAPDSPVSQ